MIGANRRIKVLIIDLRELSRGARLNEIEFAFAAESPDSMLATDKDLQEHESLLFQAKRVPARKIPAQTHVFVGGHTTRFHTYFFLAIRDPIRKTKPAGNPLKISRKRSSIGDLELWVQPEVWGH